MSAQLEFSPEVRICEWCTEPIPATARKDAVTCSKSCRQSRHRFHVEPCAAEATDPIRIALADPPYPTLSRRYYKDHPAFDGEVDHAELVSRLEESHDR